MTRFFIITFIIFLSAEVYGIVNAKVHHQRDKQLQLSVEYLRDNNQNLLVNEAINSIYHPTENKKCFDLNSSTTWYKVTVTNVLDSTVHLFLHNNRGNLSKQVVLYDVTDKRVTKTNLYDFFDKEVGSKLSGSTIVYPLIVAPNGSKIIYIKNKSLAYQCIDIEIHDENTSVRALINKNFYSNMIIVALITIAISNLLLYSFIRRKEFIYYALYLINAAVGLAYYYGIIFHHFQIYGEQVYWLNLTAINGSVFLVLFIQAVIETKKSYQTIHLLLNSVIILSIIDILFAFLFNLSLASKLVFIIFVYSFIVLGYMAIKLYHDKHPLINVFCLAYSAYIAGIAIVSFMFMGYLPLNEFTFHSSGIGIIIEALFFSYLLHHRIRLLIQEKATAEDANKRKTRFLAFASHDLRQPIHALELFLESFTGEKLSNRGKKTLSYMKKSIASLSELLTSLLDISRLDAGIVKPNVGIVEISALIKHLADNLKEQAQNKGLELRIRGQSSWANSDSILLENMLRNLLSNAIKYTHLGGILLNCRQRQNEIWIEIWDTGVGISKLELDFIFDEFYQIDNYKQDNKQGLGLGLAIVKRESQVLGHSLSLYSRENRGTMVRIKLQRIKSEPFVAKQSTSFENLDRLTGKKLLIIDDDSTILIATKMIIEQWGCVVETVANLNDAKILCHHFLPDIIISDFRLQDHITGIYAIEQLRLQLNQQIPAILITGDTTLDKLQQVQRSGLIILHKPVKPAKLRVAINRVLIATLV